MKAIGGYFGLECGKTSPYYPDGIYLNNCRNGIRYLIRTLGIRRIYIPYYTCNVVEDAISQEKCEIRKYRLDRDMMPVDDIPKDEFIVYNNYFGVSGENVRQLSGIYPNLIADNAQAFYSDPDCQAAVYSPRKFFGLPDGGILRGKDIPRLNIPTGHSSHIASHLLKRLDYGAEYGYQDFVRNDALLEDYQVEEMSSLTKALMGNLDYESVRQRRISNFNFLSAELKTEFPIKMSDDDVPMIYPLLIKDGSDIRDRLIANKVFCARYWPNVIEEVPKDSLEYDLAKNLVAIPIDQRYGEEEMNLILRYVI